MSKEQPVKSEAPKVFKLSDFFTREKAEVGAVVPLELPDGTETGQWVRVVGNESDRFHRAKAKAEKMAFDIAKISDEAERQSAIDAQMVSILVACVMDWSLDEPCNTENVTQMLVEAPYIRRLIDRAVGNRALFFGNSSTTS